MKLNFTSLFLAFALVAVPLVSFCDEIAETTEACNDENQTVTINGIILLGCHEDVLQDGGWEAGNVSAYELDLPGCNCCTFLQELSDTFLGCTLNLEVLYGIKEQILCYYRACHRPFVVVEIPPQNITQGVIQFVVMEACVGNVCGCGSSWFNDVTLASRLNVSPGDAIVTDALLTEVAWMNNNPFRQSSIRFSPGEEPGTTDIELVTCDRRPFRLYAGVDNTGNRAIGRSRYFAGGVVSDLFFRDHILTYQATTSSNVSNFFAQSANYVAPLPWKHTLYLFGGFARVRPSVDHNFKCKGYSGQASFRYEIPFGKLYEDTYQDFRFGFDYKNTNNNLIFLSDNEIPLIVNDVNLSQFMFGYDYGVYVCDRLFEASYQVFFSPGQLLGSESDQDYGELRRGATAKYVYGTITAGYVYPLSNGMTLGFVGRGQYASNNLLPSEQFGLGGYDTVRGYDEREVNVDNAACFNLELRSRPMNLLSSRCSNLCCEDQLILLAFIDYGVGYNVKTYKHEPKRYNLLGIGPGLRYNISTNLAARADLGFRLLKTPFDSGNCAVLHFGVIASY